MNRRLWSNIERAIQTARTESSFANLPVILDVGCGHRPYRECFGPAIYIGMDRAAEDSSPDILGDACHIPVRSGAVDIAFCAQVIEHIARPDRMLCELHRVLKAGGWLILSGPMYWPLHEEPFDFFRFTKHGFASLLRDAGFVEWTIQEDGGDWAQIMLAINLKLVRKWAAPLRCVINVAGAMLDGMSDARLSPANYTVRARRP